MYTSERREKILDILQTRESISVNELTEMMAVSQATIRSDLNYLGNNNLLIRTHGGAMRSKNDESLAVNKSYDVRKQKNIDKKQEIAQKAFAYIPDGECILLDASSTCFELAKLINQSDLKLTVLTNGLRTATLLKENYNLTVILIGGVVKGASNAIEGLLGLDLLKKINIDTLFTSAYAVSSVEGLSDFNLYEVELKKRFVETVPKVIALADSTKFEHHSIATFAALDQLDLLITDSHLSPEIKAHYDDLVSII